MILRLPGNFLAVSPTNATQENMYETIRDQCYYALV